MMAGGTCRRVQVWVLAASLVATCVIALPAAATAGNVPGDLADALVTVDDVPARWSEYVAPSPSPRVRTRKAVCGRSPGTPLPTEDEAWAAYARDNVEGPVFGELIDRYGPGDAKRNIGRGPIGLPCTWNDSGIRWRAEPLPRLHLGDDDRGYLRRQIDGDYAFTYNYEYRVRRGDVVLAFVLNSRTPDRKLAEKLVRRAVARYDEATSVTA